MSAPVHRSGEAPASRERHHGGRRGVVPHLRLRSVRRTSTGNASHRAWWSTTRRLLDELDRAGARATFFVLGWVAERYPDLVGEIRAGGHDIGSHGHLHAPRLRARSRDVRCGCEAERRRAARRGCRAHRRIPGARVVDQRSIAVGARMPGPRRHHARRQHGPCPHRRPRRLPAAASRAADLRWSDRRGSAAGRRSIRARDADRMGVGAAHDLAAPNAAHDRAVNAAGLPAVLTVHPWEIDPEPPRVALPARLRFAHYFSPGRLPGAAGGHPVGRRFRRVV